MSEEKKNKGKRFVVLLFVFLAGMITALLIVLLVVLNLSKKETPTPSSSSEPVSSSEIYQYENEKKIYASLTNICNRFLRIEEKEIDKIYNLNFDNENNIYLTSNIKNSLEVGVFKILINSELSKEEALNHLIDNEDFVCNEMIIYQNKELSICHTSIFKDVFKGTFKGIEMISSGLIPSTSGIIDDNSSFYSINDLRYKNDSLDTSSSYYKVDKIEGNDTYYKFISYLYFEII